MLAENPLAAANLLIIFAKNNSYNHFLLGDCSSNQSAFSTAKLQANPKPNIQAKYHMRPTPNQYD